MLYILLYTAQPLLLTILDGRRIRWKYLLTFILFSEERWKILIMGNWCSLSEVKCCPLLRPSLCRQCCFITRPSLSCMDIIADNIKHRRAQRVQWPKQTSMCCLSQGSLWCSTSVWFCLVCLLPWPAPPPCSWAPWTRTSSPWSCPQPMQTWCQVTWQVLIFTMLPQPSPGCRQWQGSSPDPGPGSRRGWEWTWSSWCSCWAKKQCLSWWPGWRGRPVGRSPRWGHRMTPWSSWTGGVLNSTLPTQLMYEGLIDEIFGTQCASMRLPEDKTVHLSS